METYPANLPCPLRAGYKLNTENNIIRTPMQSGRARQRIAYTFLPGYTDLTFLMTAVQAQLFEAWARNVGADWFTIGIKSPLGLMNETCRFMEAYSGGQLVGINLWQYTAKIEIQKAPSLDSSYGLYPDIVLNQDIFDFAINQEWPT